MFIIAEQVLLIMIFNHFKRFPENKTTSLMLASHVLKVIFFLNKYSSSFRVFREPAFIEECKNLMLLLFCVYAVFVGSEWYIDSNGVAFEDKSQKKLVWVTKSDLISYTVPKETEKIAGGNSAEEGAFWNAVGSMKKIFFANNSQLFELGNYCFSKLKLEEIDFSPCGKLKSLSSRCFDNCQKISNIIFPPNLENISPYAMYYCTNIKKLNFPNNVKIIDYCSFMYCGSLSFIIWSNNTMISRLGTQCFNVGHQTEIFIPKSIISIGSGAFSNNPITKITVESGNSYFSTDGKILYNSNKSSLSFIPVGLTENITLDPKCRYLEANSCANVRIEEIILNEGLLTIKSQCFIDSSIKIVRIPRSVTSIQSSAFIGCSRLIQVEFNASITTLNENMFCRCISLQEILIPSTVTVIQSQAFYGCSSIDHIFIPKSVSDIKSGVFAGINSTAWIEFEEGSPMKYINNTIFSSDFKRIISYIGAETGIDVVIYPPVEVIGSNAYKNRNIRSINFWGGSVVNEIESNGLSGHSFESVSLPSSIKKIHSYAFTGCSKLRSVNFGEIGSECLLESIGDSVFVGCCIETIRIPHKVKSIGLECFKNCSTLYEVFFGTESLSSQLEIIGNECFAGTGVIEVTIPRLCTSIGKNCFRKSNLKHLRFSGEALITSVPKQSFQGCNSLTSISLGSIQSIEERGFAECTSLIELNLGANIERIGRYAFEGCTALESITIRGESRLAEIESFAFSGCKHLSKFVLVDNTNFAVSPDGAILYNINLTKIIVYLANSERTKYEAPVGIEGIGAYCFAGAVKLEIVDLSMSAIEWIGFSAFEGCTKLSYVSFPDRKLELVGSTFENCPMLKCGSIKFFLDQYESLIAGGVPDEALQLCPTGDFTLGVKGLETLNSNLFLVINNLTEDDKINHYFAYYLYSKHIFFLILYFIILSITHILYK